MNMGLNISLLSGLGPNAVGGILNVTCFRPELAALGCEDLGDCDGEAAIGAKFHALSISNSYSKAMQ